MTKLLIAVGILILSTGIQAGRAKTGVKTVKNKIKDSTSAQKVKIITYSKDYPINQLKGDQYQIDDTKEKSSQDVLNPEMRDQILIDTGLYSYVSSWDHLDRDMLILRAQNYNSEVLKKKYPHFPKESLSKLQEILKKTNR